ncbi:MAG: hypothetical protein U0794_10670 [Isosphaeraceae bacterium]
MIRLVVAGDLVDPPVPAGGPSATWQSCGWLGERGVELVALQGNHDPPRRAGAHHTLTIAGWTIAHGHQPLDAPRTITGHHHPVLRMTRHTAPCFLIHASMIVCLHSRAARGRVSLDLLPLEAMDLAALRCVATAEAILDFGPVRQLISRFRS